MNKIRVSGRTTKDLYGWGEGPYGLNLIGVDQERTGRKVEGKSQWNSHSGGD